MKAKLELKNGDRITIEVRREDLSDVIDYLLGDGFIHDGSTMMVRDNTISILITR
jgi:hypothetical protein